MNIVIGSKENRMKQRDIDREAMKGRMGIETRVK